MNYTTNGWKYFTIYRTGGNSALTVNLSLSGSSKFTLVNSSVVFQADTAKDSTPRTFAVIFTSVVHDTSVATLVMTDGSRSDTVVLNGIGTGYTPPDFTVNDTFFYINVRRDSAGTYASALLQIKNELSSNLSLNVIPADSVHFNVDGHGGEVVNLSGNGAANVYINYIPHNVSTDRTTVSVTEQSSPYLRRTITVIVVDSLYMTPTYQPTVVLTKDLGLVSLGDSACGTLLIQNQSPKSMTINYLAATDSTSGRWVLKNQPSFPLTLLSGDSVMMDVCFYPQSTDYGLYTSDNIYVIYVDGNSHSGSVGRNISAHTLPCLTPTNDTIHMDDVVAGGFIEASTTIIANRSGTLRKGYSYASDSGSVSVLIPSLPKTVQAGDTVTLRVRLNTDARMPGNYYGYLRIDEDSCSTGRTTVLYGRSVASTDSTALQLFPAQSELLAMKTTKAVTIDTFWFVNNSGGEVHVTGASLTQGTYFHILGEVPHALPDTLTASQKLGVIIRLDGDTLGFYHDSLYITASNALQSMPIDLEAMVLGLEGAGVARAEEPTSVNLWLSPNPATGPVAIGVEGARHASIEIFDLLGSRVVSLPDALNTTWNAASSEGHAYIVRATGTDATGQPFTLSKRLMLTR